MIRFAILTAALAGCYKPSSGDCSYQCSAALECPDGLSCADGFCRESGATGTCAAPTDAPAEGIDDNDLLCGWGYAPLTFDPCMLAPSPVAVDITAPTTLDSDTGLLSTSGATPLPHTFVDGGATIVIHVASLSVSDQGTLTGTGQHAIIFAVDGDVTIAGKLSVAARFVSSPALAQLPGPGGGAAPLGSSSMICQTGPGADGTNNGGGGGGALATAAGKGGGVGGGNPGQPEGAFTMPLQGGCNGGHGVIGVGTTFSGSGGGGGGAIQISTRGTLTVSGTQVDAAGGGGVESTAANGGGGGGGAGGTIILEAANLVFSGTVTLCATGGSGGGGFGVPQMLAPGGGLNGFCSNTPAPGGDGEEGGGNGGNGGSGTTAPTPGTNGSGGAGGGGGGGSVGRIKLLGHTSTDPGDTTVVTPPAS